jgi:hypothetical protein
MQRQDADACIRQTADADENRRKPAGASAQEELANTRERKIAERF